MRKIEYIFIDSDTPNDNVQSGLRVVSNFGYHYIINSEGLLFKANDIQHPVSIIAGPKFDPDKYNRYSIFIRFCGSLQPEGRLVDPIADFTQRRALLNLLVRLRGHFPSAKILGISEIDGKALHCKNIIVSDAMNVLRRELSNMP